MVSLDVFRGITIAAMILVNDPGSWNHVYPPLEHAEWNGWTPTDLIFPFFLFIVGVSMTLSFASRIARGLTRGSLAIHVVRRGVLIFAIGVFLNGLPFFDFPTIRIMGVLQRIALCYLAAGLLYLATCRRGAAADGKAGVRANIGAIESVALILLVGYWALMTFVPDPTKRPEAKATFAKFEARKYKPAGYTLYTYAALQIVAQAAAITKSLDPKAMATEMQPPTV